MNKEISPLKLKQIKTAAKRLSKYLPHKSHSELLDIATHQFYGLATYREAIKDSENILKKRTDSDKAIDQNEINRSVTYGQKFGRTPTFKSGDWYFYPQDKVLVFEGEFIPYVISINQLSNSIRLLDFILQVQKKKWPKDLVKKSNICPTYQLDEFIDLINQLCTYYFNKPSQGVFSPSGESKQVVWPKDMLDEAISEAE